MVEINLNLITDDVPESLGATNLWFTEPRVRSTPLTGFSATNSAIVDTDTVLQGFNKAQGQINNILSTGITGSGTANFGAKFTSAAVIGNSLYQDNGTGTSIGLSPANATRLAIQSTGNTSTSFPLKLTNSDGNGVLFARSDRRVAIGTSSFIAVTALTLDANATSIGLDIRNFTGVGLNIINSTSSATGYAADMSGDGATAIYVEVSGIDGSGLTISAGNSHIFNAVQTGILDQNTLRNSVEIIRSFDISTFDANTSVLYVEDNCTGSNTGDVATFVKSADQFFRLSASKRIIYTDGNQAAGFVLTSDANGIATWQANGNGSVTSVAISGSDFSIGGSPITTSGTISLTLATVNSNVGTFGSATQVGQFTVNGKGLITAASNITITPAVGSITGFGTGVATFLATPSSANLLAALTDETGTGALVFANTPTLVTPALGAATATSINGLTITSSTGTLTLANGSTIATSGANSITLTSTGATNVTLPTSGTLYGTQASSITSAQLEFSLTDETGTGSVVFSVGPTLVIPVLGVATATSINKLTITEPATSAVLTIANGKTFTASNTITLTGTDGASLNVSNVVIGPASATDNAIVRFDATTGKLIQNSGVIIADNNDTTIPAHLAIGASGVISSDNIFDINETFSNASANLRNGINLIVDHVSSSLAASICGATMTVSNSASGTATPSVKGIDLIVEGRSGANFGSGAFTGLNIAANTTVDQTGTIVNISGINFLSPTFAGSKPASNFAFNVNNQGASGVTTSIGLRIAAQSGSTNNYAIASAGGNLHGFGTLTPTQTVDVNGNIQLKLAGNKFLIKEGTNAGMGINTMASGTVVVSNTLITSTSRVQLTPVGTGVAQANAGSLSYSLQTGTGFTIYSTNVLDARAVAWIIIEPAA